MEVCKLKKIEDLILGVAKEYNETADVPIALSEGAEAPLFGGEGVLDSVGLVSFVLDVEEAVNDEYNAAITLADAKAMSAKHSPFRTIGSLAEYIEKRLADKDE